MIFLENVVEICVKGADELRFSTLFSGSSGNAIYIESDNSRILVDAGLSGIKVQQALESIGRDASDLDAILVTHEHRDHICSVGILSRRFNLPVYASKATWDVMEGNLGRIAADNRILLQSDDELQLGDLAVEYFNTSHDAADPCGFIFSSGGQMMGLLTDTGCVTPDMDRLLGKCDTLIIESNHDIEMLMSGPYPFYLKERIRGRQGHLSNEDTCEALKKYISVNTHRVVLAHLSEENNRPYLAQEHAAHALDRLGCGHINLHVAPRYEPLPLLAVGKE